MPATAPELSRRAVLLASLAFSLRADAADEVWELLSTIASDLSDGHIEQFLAAFDPVMPGYQDLRSNVAGLVGQADVQSSIELVSNDGDGVRRSVEVDWLLRITGHAEVSGSTSRQQRVKCGFEKQGKRWRIVSLDPIAFFAPPRPK